jgi:hypothetical protein
MDIIDLVGITSIMALMGVMHIMDIIGIMGIIGHMMSFSAFSQNRLNPAMRDIGDDIVCRLLLTILLIQIEAHRVHISPSPLRLKMCTQWASI